MSHSALPPRLPRCLARTPDGDALLAVVRWWMCYHDTLLDLPAGRAECHGSTSTIGQLPGGHLRPEFEPGSGVVAAEVRYGSSPPALGSNSVMKMSRSIRYR